MNNNNDETVSISFKVIAHIRTPFGTKFGIPRQSGYCERVKSFIEFESPYAVSDALRGIEDFSHLWLLWHFSEADNGGEWSPTVRPPKLGGNKRVGVFATRSPFRPNPIGLSSVKLVTVEKGQDGSKRLVVTGADLMDGTPILDIKPYLAYTDSHPEAKGGYSVDFSERKLCVRYGVKTELLSEDLQCSLTEVLEQDPRPAYHNDPERIYGLVFDNLEVKFKVDDNTQILTVLSIDAKNNTEK